MARRVKHCTSKLWRNIRFRVRWHREGDDFEAIFDSAKYFPRASIDDVTTSISLWVDADPVLFSIDIDLLDFKDSCGIWPDDGGHDWKRDSALAGACPGNVTTWYKCAGCNAQGKRISTTTGPVIRCTGDKVCPAWRRRAAKRL